MSVPPSHDMNTRIGLLGAGAWGTALASVAVRAGGIPRLWAREDAVVQSINNKRTNPDFLPGITLDPAIRATRSLSDLASSGMILSVVPAQHQRTVLSELGPHLAPGTPIVICAKGVEQDTGKLMSEVVREAVPHGVPAVLSGPSFAADVARGLPTAITLAAEDLTLAEALAARIGIATFRPYASSDPIGAQIGGTVKNVLAIACGIVDGRGLGTSARAALTARGFAEMTRLGQAMGGRLETLTGLSGLGDLVLTCNSSQSRNMTLGQALGRGIMLEDAVERGKGIAEGVYSAQAVARLAKQHKVDMPISTCVAEIVQGRMTVGEAIDHLLSRPFKAEH